MSYVTLADLRSGLGQTTTAANVAIPGGIASLLTVYPTAAAALQAGNAGMLFTSGPGQISFTGPAGATVLKDPNTIYPTAQAALAAGYGTIFPGGVWPGTQSGTYYATTPYGPLTINSPPLPAAAAKVTALTGTVNPTAKAVLATVASGLFQALPPPSATTINMTTPVSPMTGMPGAGYTIIGSDQVGRPVYGLAQGYTVATAMPPTGLVTIGFDTSGNPVYGQSGGVYTPAYTPTAPTPTAPTYTTPTPTAPTYTTPTYNPYAPATPAISPGTGYSVIGTDQLGRSVYGLTAGYTTATASPPTGMVSVGVDANGYTVYGTSGGTYSAASPAGTYILILLLGAAAVGGYFWWKSQQPPVGMPAPQPYPPQPQPQPIYQPAPAPAQAPAPVPAPVRNKRRGRRAA